MDKYVKLINSLWCNGDGIAEETDGLGCANKKCKYRDVDGACDLTNMALDAAAAITDLQAENIRKDRVISRQVDDVSNLINKIEVWKHKYNSAIAALTRVEAERDALRDSVADFIVENADCLKIAIDTQDRHYLEVLIAQWRGAQGEG